MITDWTSTSMNDVAGSQEPDPCFFGWKTVVDWRIELTAILEPPRKLFLYVALDLVPPWLTLGDFSSNTRC